MKKIKKIVHFNVDKHIQKHLKGDIFTFSIQDKLAGIIPNKETVDAISVTSFSIVNETTLKYFPKLRLLITRSVGTDHIDLTVCKKRRIAVYHIPDYGAYNIAEHAFSLLLAAAKNIIKAKSQVQKGKFYYENFLSIGLKGKTLGVIGTGKIGLSLIKMAKAFDLRIIAYDLKENKPAAKEFDFAYVSLKQLLKESDFISLHVPLLPNTKHMIGDAQIKLMKDGVVLVNTARGGVIDTKALVKNINKFKAVALDVLEEENTFSKNHPLLRYEHVIITPHTAFFTDNSVKKIGEETIISILKFRNNNNSGRVV